MNKQFLLFFLTMPVSILSMEGESGRPIDYKQLCKRIGAREYRFEDAKHWIERVGGDDPKLKAFARTFLRVKESRNFKTYKLMFAELDKYKSEAINIDELTINTIETMKATINNWQTDNPQHAFKYANDDVRNFLITKLGLQEPAPVEKKRRK